MRPRVHLPRAVLLALPLLLCAANAEAQRRSPLVRTAIPRATVGLADSCTTPLPALPEMVASGGVLSGRLEMKPATYTISGRSGQLTSNVYNGGYNAPTLRVGLGEIVRLNVINNMQAVGGLAPSQVDTTNQHYHGLVVSPLPTAGDNVTNVFIPWNGGSNLNEYLLLPAIDSVQSQGLMWYHPHPHGSTLPQVAGGLAGPMVVGDLLSYFPEYRGAKERILTIKTPDSGGSPVLNINQVQCPRMEIIAGQQELWRILNATGNTFLNLKLDGYTFTVLAFDGNPVVKPFQQDSLFIPPGGRAEVIITGGQGDWSANLVAAPSLGGSSSPVKIGELRTRGLLAEAPAALQARETRALARINPILADSMRRLTSATDVDTFTLRFRFDGTKNVYLLNDSTYSAGRLDRAVQTGRVQEWTLVNLDQFRHTFHIHQTDFLIVEVNGRRVEQDSVFYDNVNLGVHKDSGGNTVGDIVKVRFKFHPVAAGPFVYHCHVLSHEDLGMMANICVYLPGQQNTCSRWFPGTGGGHSH
ncbi:MAG TPA: multicopper oxidase family protein [Longimicrobium sp.]|nr:multicopper oxidase family protein [Longimicrobium sp.]